MFTLIRTEALSRRFHVGPAPLLAVSAVSLEIASRESVAIIGPSGSGKSTLLYLLGLLDRPTSGRYWFEGQPTDQLSNDALATIRPRRIGFVFQSFNLLPRASAAENAGLPLLYSGASRQERRLAAERALDRVGLSARADQPARELSGGEQQRVAIARALACKPTLILADEPTGALDSRSGARILDLFDELGASGITIITVTHDPAVAARARRVLEMHDGCLCDVVERQNAPGARGIREAFDAPVR